MPGRLGSDTDSVLGWAASHQGWTLRPKERASLVSRSQNFRGALCKAGLRTQPGVSVPAVWLCWGLGFVRWLTQGVPLSLEFKEARCRPLHGTQLVSHHAAGCDHPVLGVGTIRAAFT